MSNETLVVLVFSTLTESLENLTAFFDSFVKAAAERNLTAVDANVRRIVLNLTLTALEPRFYLLDAEGLRLWFQVYLPLFLPGAESRTFQVLPRNVSCSSYHAILKGFDNIILQLSGNQNQLVFQFVLDYLKGQLASGVSCANSGNVTDDRRWLMMNFGQFRFQASFNDFLMFNINFTGVDVADLLSVAQLSELSAIRSQLNGTQDVIRIMSFINASTVARFFHLLSAEIKNQSTNYTQEIRTAFLQEAFARAGLMNVSDEELLLWLKVRLRPLLVRLAPSFVSSLASIGGGEEMQRQPGDDQTARLSSDDLQQQHQS